MKKFIKICLILVLSMGICIKVEAKTLNQIKKELNNMKAQYKENQSKKALTESEMNQVKSKISDISSQIVKTQNDINDINNDIDARNQEIEKMNEEIKSIVHYYQLSSSESFYLEYVFNAKDFTDFIYRLAISEQLSEYRKNMINQYKELIEKNKQEVSKLADKKSELKGYQNELSGEYNKLGTELNNISEAAIDIKDEIADLEKMVNLYESKYKCGGDEDVSACVNRVNSANARSRGSSSSTTAYGSLPSAAGFYRPTAFGTISTNYGDSVGSLYYKPHQGIDVSVPHGTTVYAIADGTVVKVNYKNNCGGNMVFIAHKVNGKTYTSGYYHLASINVSVGQSVTYNTVVGSSGGNQHIETWDHCSYTGFANGGHLHLQIATGLYMTDYFTYSAFEDGHTFNPRNVLNFPAKGASFSGR